MKQVRFIQISRKTLAVIMISAMAAGLLDACGKQENLETATGESTLIQGGTTDKPVSADPLESKAVLKEASVRETETQNYREPVSITEDEIKHLSNKRQESYFGGDTNNKGVSLHCLDMQEKYNRYNADFVRYGDDGSNNIYLTFDEGYENGYTARILDVLKEKNVKAVFFCTMDYLKSEPELVKRMITEGHIVGNHSVTHPSAGMISLSLAEQKAEMEQMDAYMAENFDGYRMQLFRYPAGIFSEQSLALMGSLGYTSVFWSFAHADWDPNNQPDETKALKKCVDKLHPGANYLLHAVSKTNTNILGDFIDQARAKGYEFEAYY